MTPETIAMLAAALLTGGAAVAIVNAIAQRRKVGADATAVITAAARELVDPLRKELAQEREENAAEIASERAKVKLMKEEMDECVEEARLLRRELHDARVEAARLRTEREEHIKRIRDLERIVARGPRAAGSPEYGS